MASQKIKFNCWPTCEIMVKLSKIHFTTLHFHEFQLNFLWFLSLPCPALHQLLALISELKLVQQVTSDQNTPVSWQVQLFLSFCCFLKRSGFQGPCVHTLVQLAFFLGVISANRQPISNHQAVPNLRPNAGSAAQPRQWQWQW